MLVGLNSSSLSLLVFPESVFTFLDFEASAADRSLPLIGAKLGLLLTNTFADYFRALPELPSFLFFERFRWV